MIANATATAVLIVGLSSVYAQNLAHLSTCGLYNWQSCAQLQWPVQLSSEKLPLGIYAVLSRI